MSRKLVNGELEFDTVARHLDEWVDHHPWARGGWVPAEQNWEEFVASHRYRPKDNAGVTPIQQVRAEILGLVEVLLETIPRKTAVEIGMGSCGGSHFLWSLMFDRVITIDADRKPIERYIEEHQPHEGQSTFVFGRSYEQGIVNEAGRIIQNCDFLLIDGDHTRDAVEADWRMYSHLVEPGGIIAFHDTMMEVPGELEVASFVHDLESGQITGNGIPVKHIHRSKFVGISYYQVT